MNFIKKLLKDDDDELYDDRDKYKDEYSDEKLNARPADNSTGAAAGMGDTFDDIPPVDTAETASRPGVGVRGSGAAVSLRVIKPKSYDDGPEIADFIAGGCTVVMNIEDLSRENARRLIDFLLGAVHVFGGDLQMASANTFVVAPCSVGVSGNEEKDENDGAAAGVDASASIGEFITGEKVKVNTNRTAGGFGFSK
jgi:FtsZ-interacting cell division protein YlmF